MGDNYIGEVRALPFPFTPAGWMACQGQLLPLAQNTALFSLIGITYGGDGKNSFGLPNLAPLPSANGGTLHYCIALQGVYPPRS